ncbi:osteocrin [Heterodontus francisci]|uniref:osteocrin n=1 Tax=Heterodontus francisci TaxID=7792 RepID=UPI00355BDF54
MLGSGQNFLHLLLVLSFMGWSDGAAPGKEAPEESVDLSPWAKAVPTSISVQGNHSGPSNWLPFLNHLAGPQIDVAAKKRRRSLPHSGFRSNRSSVKSKTIKSKQRHVPDGRRRRINFPIDRIGRTYLPKIKY